MASSSTNPYPNYPYPSEFNVSYYPYPSEFNVSDLVPDKLSKSNYSEWKPLMLDFIESRGMNEFIHHTAKDIEDCNDPKKDIEDPNFVDYKERSWRKSDGLVRTWILSTLNKDIIKQVLHHKTAREVWEALETWLGPQQPGEKGHHSKKHKSSSKEDHRPTVVEDDDSYYVEDLDDDYRDDSSHIEGAERRLEIAEGRLHYYMPLHIAAIQGDVQRAENFIHRDLEAIWDSISTEGETVLITAIRSVRRNELVKYLLRISRREHLAQSDNLGRTALHEAAEVGNLEAAEILMAHDHRLLYIEDEKKQTPLTDAAKTGNREMVRFLLDRAETERVRPTLLLLLYHLANSGLYDIALELLQQDSMLELLQQDSMYTSMSPGTETSPLMAMSQKRSSFRSGTPLNSIHKLIYSIAPAKLRNNATKNPAEGSTKSSSNGENPDENLQIDTESSSNGENPDENLQRPIDTENPANENQQNPQSGAVNPVVNEDLQNGRWHAKHWHLAEQFVPPIKHISEIKLKHDEALELVKCLCQEIAKLHLSKATWMLTPALAQATSSGIREIVEEILRSYPAAIYFKNENNQSIFQSAIVWRRENVFNLIYQLKECSHKFLSVPDRFGNNALHLAGSFGPQQHLSVRVSAAGAALQMQRELQWFKEVEKFALPQDKECRNHDGMTPAEVFTKTHKELVEAGERWMKDTATSCTIVAALIATVMFAAAITVPGGNNGSSGVPILSKRKAFVIFGLSDALALFASIASLLMFLSILTARYAEEDFLYSLPNRLIIGLVNLFLSISSTMTAFGATLYLMFGENRPWIIYPIVAFAYIPVHLFVSLLFPLLVVMYKSTHHPAIFGKQSDHMLF